MASERKDAERKRKAHKKSRRGCRNCKLRRVKAKQCDEARPMCVKCTDYGVSCNYSDSKAPDLQISFHGFAAPVLQMIKLPRTQLVSPPIIMDNFQPSSFQLDRQMLDRLGRFRTRTVFSIGDKEIAKLYQKEAVELACRAPYLMHIIQTITMIHDRYLSGDIFSKSLIDDICYHWTQGVSLFNRKLSFAIEGDDRDPLWATAALSGIIAFAAIDATNPEEAWPLKPPDDSDLDWLRMSEGKNSVFKLTNPLREDSVFHTFLKDYFEQKMQQDVSTATGFGAGTGGPLIGPGLERLPWQFIRLCGLDNPDEPSPYLEILHSLGKVLPMDCTPENVIHFLGFLGHCDAGFKKLLETKDHRALLVLAFWYAKVCNTPIWWMDRRATIECQAICLYLGRNSADLRIHELLDYPRARCGLGSPLLSSPDGSPVSGFGGMQNCFSVIAH
ncbi:Sterol regulatory element-binding ECM22 [Hyphodiscus hymeniophilus]|uniref:Sterol regulatory element-binding ECM22 n=1 Tax=Hyphodiscus hymeniophilus TaxID=353542 RepID=A0A9P6SQL2_9HELO|nr:Sterol regulatory element-binding ECM22 [Hyphodiscus hymeniophilus]